MFPAFRAAFRGALALFSALAQVNGVRGGKCYNLLGPPPSRKFDITFALRRIRNGILAGFAVCILVLAAPDAHAACLGGQGLRIDGTCGPCPTGQFVNTEGVCADDVQTGCMDNTPTTCFEDACDNAGWGSNAATANLFCDINSRNAANGAEKSRCLAPGQSQSATNPHCSEIFGPYSQDRVDVYFPQKPPDGSEPHYVYNCDPDGDKGLIPATINTIGATECACAIGGQPPQNGVCIVPGVDELIAEIEKTDPSVSVVLSLLAREGVSPNITTSAGTPILVVAATLLHAKVVSVLITAGADVSVKMDGIFDSDINPTPRPRFIPMGLVEHGFHSRLPVGRRMAETFIHFGDAAGGRFDWSAQEAVYNQSVGVAAYHILDGQRRIFTGNELPFVRTMAQYLLDLGVECGSTNAYFQTSIPASFCARPSCRARDSGKAYSCSVCAGLPLRSANGASCVAACRGDAEADTTTWPDSQCKCPDGATEDEFGCQSDHDSTLIAEVQKRSPELAVVRDLLNKGARPNITISAGTPLLIVAATLGHAKIVSVLVTAGADANARDSDENAVPHIVAINDFGSAPLHYSWGKALNVLRHFADAVNQSGAAYDWTSTRINGLRAVEILEYRYSAAAAVWSGETVPEKEKAMLRMANIMLANGDSCLSSRTWSSHITCTGSGSQLLAEVQKAPGAANLSVVLERLNDDVGPDIADANGVPVLIVAATMGHAEIVSVLVTAGANVTAKDPNVSDMLNVVHHAATPLNRPAAGPRSLRASVLYYFGGGLDVRNAASGDAVFDWNAESASGYRPLDILFNATAPDKLALAGEDENLIREMSDYIRAEGGRCGYRTNTDDHTSWVCMGASVENCGGLTPAKGYDSTAGACVACSLGQLIKSGVCAAPTTPEEKCTAAKWSYNFGEDACYINFKISGGSNQMACKFDDAPAFLNYIPCEDVFGADYSLPLKPSGSNPVYVYNCDPNDESGLIPATVNTIGATECTCPAGHVINNGVCVCPSGQGLLDNGSCGTCPPGQEVIDNVCIVPVSFDMDLVAEVEKTEPGPVLSSVRALLEAGANPNATVTGGLPLLFEAGRRGHADIVSVLVTFGVNASVQVGQDYFPEYMAPNGLSGSPSTATVALPWRRLADVMIHFGDAARAFGLTAGAAAYDWSATQGQYHVLAHLGYRYNNFNPSPEEKRVMDAIGGYILDQGSACPGNYVNHPICTSRPSCPATEDVLYSCSKCEGYPHLSVDGAACVADGACRADSTLNTEIWPSPQCECDLGDAYFSGAGECPALLDKDLVAVVENSNAALSSVRALLGAGANPNATVTGGLPLLFEAGRLGHADIVSVLVTFGVNASVKINNKFFPEYMSENGLDGGAPAATGKGVLPWRDAADVVIHFGEALKVFALTSTIGAAYDWNVKGKFWPLDYLQHRYNKFDSVKNDPAALAVMEVMAGYMLDQGSPCNNAYINHPICTSRPECPAIGGSPYHTCSECAGYPHISADGAACVADGGCRAGASANAAAWPASQCECDNGALNAAGECPDLSDADLIAEVEKPGPVLSSVRALLNAGADPDAAWRPGVPLLLAAATLGHAQIVSVLVTAGANPQAADFSYYDLDVVQHAATPLDARAAGPRSLRASVLYHFGGGLDVRDADFDWNREDRNGYRAMDILNNATKDEKITLAGEDQAVIDGMANYMLARGASCGYRTLDRTQGVCVGSGQVSLVRSSLFDELEKAPGTADTSEFLRLLGEEGGHPDVENSDRRSLLILAARNGHAELVSILVTLGANVNAEDAIFHRLNVAHHMATPMSDPAAGPRSLRASVLYHFSGALDVRNARSGDAGFDWNKQDANKFRALDILVNATANNKRNLEGENVTVIYEMAEHMIRKGAECGYRTSNKLREVCIGRLGFSLAEAVKDPNASADEVRLAAQAMVASGISINVAGNAGILAVAAESGHAAAVSVLLTFGVKPDGRGSNNRGVLHFVGQNSGVSAPTQLQILRHFIGGLEVAGKTDSFNGWNAESGVGRPLDALQNHPPTFTEGLAAYREIQALLYERGARCEEPADKTYCQIPAETALIPAFPPDTVDFVLTVTARDFGGTFFDLQLPDAVAVATMSLRGWRMDRVYGPPWRAVLSRTRALRSGDDFPTAAAVTMLNGGQAVRRINIASQSGGAPFIVTVIGQGSVSIAANGAPIQNGGTILRHHHVEIVATPDSAAYHVSDWSGPCATARKGADGGERTCELIFNGEDNRVTVTFSPGRLGRYVPATGYIPDGPNLFKDTGKTALTYFCQLFDGYTEDRKGVQGSGAVKRVCQTFGGGVPSRCDSPGTVAGFHNRPDCGSSYFRQIRKCNAQNKPATYIATTNPHSADGTCGTACDAAAGMVARGKRCESVSDQCAASPAPACHADAACADPDVFADDADAELCTCNRGFHGDGLSCRSTTPTIERFPFFVTVIGQGAVRIRAGRELIESGQSIQANLGVEIVAEPGGRAYHVSLWTGPCAAAPKGADGGERTCEFFFNPEANRVTVAFSPGRLAPTLPASGYVPDGAIIFGNNFGPSQLEHFCRLLGGHTDSQGSKVYCVMPGYGQCDSPGVFGFGNVVACGPHVFGRIRDCNVENKPGLSASACGEPCDAAAGMAARGLSCEAVGDQCAAPFLPSGCDAQAVCSDPNVEKSNTPAELCTCTGGLAGDGVTCGELAASAELLAEVKKPAGAANVSMVLTLLGFGANANIADGPGGPAALIIAATLGHAEIVSVLVTAGASVNARWNSGNPGRAVPHIAAINNFGTTLHYPWKTALNVLRHFADAVDQKGATYNWNSNGGGPFRAIELLEYRYSNGAAVWGGDSVWPAESVSVKYEAMEEMTEILLENGDDCRAHVAERHITCQGSLRAALAEVVALGAIETSAADIRAAAQTVIAAGLNLRTAQRDADHNGGGYVVAIAAVRGHAEAVSILVTFGADAGGKTSNDRAALHHIGRGSGDDAPGRLTVLRYFIGGLRAAGKLDTFAGWNAGSGIGFPLDILQNYAPKPTDAAAREIQKLMWEGGSRCATPAAKTYCQIPREERLAAAYSAGSGLTVRGRDFRGTVFVFSPPSAELNMSLAASGWRTTLESSEEEFLILRTREPLPSDTSVEFTVTAFAGAGGDAVRVYDIEAAATATVGVSYKTVPNDGSRGRVSASGEGLIGSNAVYAGSRVTFTATPETGHGVFAWETNGADCPRGAVKCVAVAPVDSDLLVTARFEPTYPAGYGEMPNDKTGGTLTAEGLVGEDRVFSGTTVTFRARPAAGWLFSAWQGDGAADCLPSNLECELPAGNDGLFVTVQFVQGRLVEYQSDPSDESGGTLTVAGLARDNTAEAGASVTFTASPAPGWELSAWEGDVGSCVAPDLECILPADNDLRVTAVFLQSPQIRYEANPPDESGGSVTVAGTDGNVDSVDFVYLGGTVTFTATPKLGWELSAWEGCSSSGLECELTVNDDVQVTAHFSQAPRVRYAANPPDESGGRVTVAGADGNAGDADFVYSGGTVTFTATPVFGWEVSAWEGDVGDCVAPALECEAAANMDLYVTVGFSRVTVRVEAANIPAAGGSVTVQLPGLDYAFLGSDVTFTATPADGWYALGWEGLGTAGCTGLECVVMIATEADVLVTVRFAEVTAQTVRVEYVGDPPFAGKELSVELPGADFAFLGATLTFTATPVAGWFVEGWSGEGTAGCSGVTCAAVADEDLYVTVHFAPVAQARVAVEYETVPEGGGGELSAEDLPGENFAFEGVTVTFKATPMPGWTIAAWEGDASVHCSASSLTCVLVAGSDLVVGVRFRRPDCVAENREGSGSACRECKAGYGEMGSYCVEKATGDFGIAPQSEICRALQGGGEAARLEGDGEIKVCSGVDKNDTFCLLDSRDGLPCRGLFRHVLRCNMAFNRLALNPFFCGKACEDDPSKPRAVGGECRP